MKFLLSTSSLLLIFTVLGITNAGSVQHTAAQKQAEEAAKSGNQEAINAAEKELERTRNMMIGGGTAAATVPILGWIVGLSTLIAGEEEHDESIGARMNCWQQILHSTELSDEEIHEYAANGLPMPVLHQYADHAIIPQLEGAPQCVFRNKLGERFVVAPSYMDGDVLVTHTTPYHEQKLLK